MNCYSHRDQQSIGICKACQKAVCSECVVDTGRGLACSTECASEVNDLNAIVDKSKRIYSIGSSSNLPPTGIIMFFFFGLVFFGFGVYQSMNRDRIDYFAIIMGLGFLLMALISYVRNKKVNLN